MSSQRPAIVDLDLNPITDTFLRTEPRMQLRIGVRAFVRGLVRRNAEGRWLPTVLATRMSSLGVTYRQLMQSGNGRNPPTNGRGVAHGATGCDCQPFASVVAPVMIATASVGVCDFGVMTPAHPPSLAI